MPSSSYIGEIKTDISGFISSIETRKLGLLLIELGGGRKQINDEIDYLVGYENVVSIGDSIDSSTPLLKVHTSSENDFKKIKKEIEGCFVISDKKNKIQTEIYKTIN